MDDLCTRGSGDSGFEDNLAPPDPNSPSVSPAVDRLPSLPTPLPLMGHNYSLLPDMIFGWQPKLAHGGPIPLLFDKAEFPVSRSGLTNEENWVVFRGFRPKDSLVMHRTFSSSDSYPVPSYPAIHVYEILHSRDQLQVANRPFEGMDPRAETDDIAFDSKFESGNLDMAAKVRDREYDLYMRTDANTRGHLQWFYFAAVAKTSGDIRFNILNFTKSDSLYTQGMLPIVFNESTPELGWHPAGSHVRYKSSKINPYATRVFFSLSFTYCFKRTNAKVYFAYATPYTYTRLRNLLGDIGRSTTEMIYKRETLCKSLSGVDVPLLTVTDFSVPMHTKSHVVVTARVHPGETYGSYMMEVRCK